MYELRVESGPDAGRVFVLHEGVCVIGRHSSSEYMVADPFVSRDHCAITVTPHGARLENKSQFGTLVDGKSIEAPLALAAGMRIKLGQSATELVVVVKRDTPVEHGEPLSGFAVTQESEHEHLGEAKLGAEHDELPEQSSGFGVFPLPRVAPVPPAPRERPSVPEPPGQEDALSAENTDPKSGAVWINRDGGDTPKGGSIWLPPSDLEKIIGGIKPDERPTRRMAEDDVEARRQNALLNYRARLRMITWGSAAAGLVVAGLLIWL